jgi:hypothetical protein
MDIIACFNQNKRDSYWNKINKGISNEVKCKELFNRTLQHLLLEIKLTNNNVPNNYYRWIGYDGIGSGVSGITSGIKTEEAKSLASNKTTADHLIGTVQIGKYVHSEFEKSGFDIDYMVNTWLYENLWLWMSIRVSKKEHHKDNILRNVNSIEEKLSLKHYINVSELSY